MTRETRIINGLLLLSVFWGPTAKLIAASVELWPADRRRNNTLYCYGNEWNMFKISLYSDKTSSSNSNGKYKIELPKSFTESTILEVQLPRVVEFLGASLSEMNRVNKEFETVDITENGKEYKRIRIPLDSKKLNERMRDTYYDVFVWYKPPESLDDQVSWTLTYDGKVLASSSNRFRTAGVIRDGRKLPRRFVFYPYGSYSVVPDGNFEKLSGFYKRFGMTGIVSVWSCGLPQREVRLRKMLETNHRYGIKNIANMDTFCGKYSKSLDTANSYNVKNDQGLVGTMDNACKGIESEAAKKEWKEACRYFDMALYDWEPAGPHTWPGYDDAATLSAFARDKAIDHPVTSELAKTKYRRAYARYRMEQTARPLYSLKKTITAVKPMPLMVEQGDGFSRNIDYEVYGNDFEILRPMIYKPSPLAYARDVMEMLNSTSIPAKKFIPDLTIGWPSGGSLRESPEEFLLDTMVSAAAGLGGIGHWPEIYRTDGALFGIHEGLARIALVEDFYFDGTPINTISVTGISFQEKTIDLGSKMLTLYAPDWRPVLFSFVHKLKDECLITILNYHSEHDAFVRISSPALKKLFLVNPVDQVYRICDETGNVIVRVARESPALWIATANPARVAGYDRIEENTIQSQFKSAKEKYLKINLEGDVQIGQVGQINVVYDQIEFNSIPSTCLRVSTPMQTLFLGESGGRIYDWTVNGTSVLAGRKGQRIDGIGMDLLWLPESARWSGDEVSSMKLKKCKNDGQKVHVIYEGEFKKGYPGIKLQKEYTIPASVASITVGVTLINEQAGPVTISYWQHNMFMSSTFELITTMRAPLHIESGEFVVPAQNLPDAFRSCMILGGTIVQPTGTVFAQYFPENETGMVFRLPDNFMNVYFWSSPKRNVSTTEWMSRPLTLPASKSETLRYSITAVPKTTVKALSEQVN